MTVLFTKIERKELTGMLCFKQLILVSFSKKRKMIRKADNRIREEPK